MGINVWFLFQYCICSFGLPKLRCTFFCLDAKEPKNQGSHCGGYGLGRYAKISENSLRSNSRDFLTLRSVDRLTPPPLGRNNWKSRIENWKFIRPDYTGVFNSPLSLVNASRGAACCASIPTRQDKTINNTISPFVFIDCYLVVQNDARQVPWINEGEKENCQSSIINCQLDWPRSGER